MAGSKSGVPFRMDKSYRKLTGPELTLLQSQGCTAADWTAIEVAEGFDPLWVRGVTFGGAVRIGATGGDVPFPGGITKKSGIYNSSIYNCTIGDHVLISNVGSHVANYTIGGGTVVENVGTLACEGVSSFGNGVEVSSINEAGGREVPICDFLTAQTAYIIAMYRHRPLTVRRLTDMIGRYTAGVASERGEIGRDCRITNSTRIINVRMGDSVTVDSASSLRNGTINSTAESPSQVGVEVIASDFIMARSSAVDTGSLLRRCFVGEGTMIENGYSAENSLFFANCHCNHGEACAVFAGPYTVTHHRATLLIAGYYSFFNAGSGANQSNHMYKSGPVHQGVHLRGCKFGSDAYILLPARTGAFTTVTGRHYSHYDTKDMPFSYLVDEEGASYLVPGATIRSSGTSRDVNKWPRRDKRTGIAGDIINFRMMTPYTAGQMLRAIETAQTLLGKYPTAEVYNWKRVKIRPAALKKGLSLYRQAMYSYLGGLFAPANTVEEGAAAAPSFVPTRPAFLTPAPDTSPAHLVPPACLAEDFREWVDLAGMIAPRIVIQQLLDEVDEEKIDSLDALNDRLRAVHNAYERYEMQWAWYAVSVLLGKRTQDITAEDIAALVRQGDKDRASLREAVELDGGRDVAPLMAIGYGIDTDEEPERSADFNAVRGL